MTTTAFDPKKVTIDVQENFTFADLKERWASSFESDRIPWQQFR